MGKQKKLRAAVPLQVSPEILPEPLKVGCHTFPVFTGADVAFGAPLRAYPPIESVPDGLAPYEEVFSKLFFRGGKLDDFGLSIKPGLDRGQVMGGLRALMGSFEPKHEHKQAVVAWCLREWCDGSPSTPS